MRRRNSGKNDFGIESIAQRRAESSNSLHREGSVRA
jgi:hypothetical protein